MFSMHAHYAKIVLCILTGCGLLWNLSVGLIFSVSLIICPESRYAYLFQKSSKYDNPLNIQTFISCLVECIACDKRPIIHHRSICSTQKINFVTLCYVLSNAQNGLYWIYSGRKAHFFKCCSHIYLNRLKTKSLTL